MTSRRHLIWGSGILLGTAACAVEEGLPSDAMGLGDAGWFAAGGGTGVPPGAGGFGFPGGGAPPLGSGGTPPPPGCGNGTLEPSEACEGANMNGQSCASATMNALPVGFISCTPSCTIDVSGCSGNGVGGAQGTGGMDGLGGSLGAGGSPFGAGGALPGAGGAPPGAGGSIGGGSCCSDGNCLCHGPAPTALTSAAGPFTTATLPVSTGTVHYPTNAEPPFAGVAICPGFINTGPEMTPWGAFYASHGIVTVVTNTLGTDFPDIRATKLLASITALKAENTKSGSPLFGKMSDRYGTSGYSMGGGGTTIASVTDKTLRTSIGLAAWGPATSGIQTPTLLLCGTADTVAPCNQSQGAYNGISGGTPKMMISIQGSTHFNWFGPQDAGAGTSGKYALAFQKVFLEGDERWRPLLLSNPTNGTRTTTIQ